MYWKAVAIRLAVSYVVELVGMLGRRMVRKYKPSRDISTVADVEVGTSSNFGVDTDERPR